MTTRRQGLGDLDGIYAVLTGDLIKSSRLSTLKSRKAMDDLKKAVTRFGRLHPGSVAGELDPFRHDSWQLLLKNPELALRVAVFLLRARGGC